MNRLLKGLALASGGLLLLLVGGAVVADRLLATEVLPISPKAPEVVRIERGLWEPGQPVASIYGVPAEQPLRVLLVDRQRLIRPQEDPSLVLLAVDKQRGDNPLQVKTVWFFVLRAAVGLGGVILASLALLMWQRRRVAPQATT